MYTLEYDVYIYKSNKWKRLQRSWAHPNLQINKQSSITGCSNDSALVYSLNTLTRSIATEYIAILSTSLRTAQRVASKHATGSISVDHDKANRLEWPVFPWCGPSLETAQDAIPNPHQMFCSLHHLPLFLISLGASFSEAECMEANS